MDERERIKILMNSYGLSASQFADKTDIQRASVSHIINGRNKPSLEIMIKIYQAFPDIDFKWLLMGEGNPPEVAENKELDFIDFNESTSSVNRDCFEDNITNNQSVAMHPGLKSEEAGCKTEHNVIGLNVGQKVKEIKVFYENGTYQTFIPEA